MALAGGVTFTAALAVATDYDQAIMSQAWDAYAPAFPTTVTGVVFAIVGWCLFYGPLLLLGTIFGSRSRAAA